MKKKGFTLIGLMVVILIAAILVAVILPILHGGIESAKKAETKRLNGVAIEDPNIKEISFCGEMEGWKYSFSHCIGEYCSLELEEPNRMSFRIWDSDDSWVVGDSEYDYYEISTEGSKTVFKKGHMMMQATEMLREWRAKIMEKRWRETLVKHGYIKPYQPESPGAAAVNAPLF